MSRPLALSLAALALTGCTETAPATDKPVGMANPAAVFCVERGGTVELRPLGLSAAEGVAGFCHLPDGRVVEEWAYFREHNKAEPPAAPAPATP